MESHSNATNENINLREKYIFIFHKFCTSAWFQIFAAVYMRSPLFWDFRQRRLVLCYWRFGATNRFHLQTSSLTLEDAPIGSPETSVTKHHSTLRKIPEGHRSRICTGMCHRNFCNSTKSWIPTFIIVTLIFVVTCGGILRREYSVLIIME